MPVTSVTRSSTTPRAVTTTGLLQVGSRGERVRQVQQALRSAGLYSGALDGIFGRGTAAAVTAFQRSRRLPVDGVVGPRTLAALGLGGASPRTPTTPSRPSTTGRASVDAFVSHALAQNGDRYVFGAETRMSDPNPRVFDCSELVEWAAHQVGVDVPDGSQNQRRHSRNAGLRISVEQALRTRGALLFTDGHVAISLGDGRTIEARSSRHGVGIFNGRGRGWEEAGLIPGMRY